MVDNTNTSFQDLRDSWAIQRRVIWALVMREILTRYGRHNIGFLWLFVEPMIFTLMVTALWSASKSLHGSTIPIVAFAVTGYSSVLLWRNMPARTIEALTPNAGLLHHRNVRPIDAYLSRIVLEIAGATTAFVVLVLFFYVLGWLELPENLVQVTGGWLLSVWFGSALALFLGALSERTEIVQKFWKPTSYIVFPLSGAAFLVDWLPKQAQDYVLLLPMVHGVEYLREGFFGSQINAHYDIPYMVIINAVLTLFGLSQVRAIQTAVVPE